MANGERIRVTVPVDDQVMTKQAPAEEQSVSALLRRYVNQGLVPANGPPPTYGDFTGIGDYQECLDRVMAAQRDFELLPARVRRVAENSPGMFLEMIFGGQPEVVAELVAAGLAVRQVPPAVEPPVPEPVAPQPPA